MAQIISATGRVRLWQWLLPGSPPAVSENDPAVLALKAWHSPVDPHRYSGAMRGALALPMLAPHEIEALSQFAHGAASSLEALASHRDDSIAALREAMASMAQAIAALGKETAALKQLPTD